MVEAKKDEAYSDNFAQNFRFFLLYLKRKIVLLVIVVIAAGFVGFFVHKRQQSQYEGISTFILEEKGSSGGGLAGLASQFGFSVGGLGGGGSLFAGDNILEILKSKKVVRRVLLTGTENGGPSLADLYSDATGLRAKWRAAGQPANISLRGPEDHLSLVQDSLLNEVYERVLLKSLSTERIARQGTIIRIKVNSPHPVFSRLMTERLVDEASTLYLTIRVGGAQENIRRLQARSDSLLFLLNRKSYVAATSQPLDLNPGLRTGTVPMEIATRDKAVLATLYAEVTKNLEASRLLLSQQTPVIQVLDTPGRSLKDEKPGLPVTLGIAVAIGLLSFLAGAYVSFLMTQLFAASKK